MANNNALINAYRKGFQEGRKHGDRVVDLDYKIAKWQMKPFFNRLFDDSDVAVMIRCSRCGMKLIAQKCGPFPNYCANCGAKMEAE